MFYARFYRYIGYPDSYIGLKQSFIIKEAKTMKIKEVYEFLKNCGTYYLATVEGDL